MEGVITSFRRGRTTQNTKQMLILIDEVDSAEKAKKLIGKKVEWEAPGKSKKVLKGEITALHGRKGVVRALFETGMPGQSLGQKVKITS